MPASEPDVGSCTGSAAIELLLSLGEAVEDDGFRRVGTVGKEFRKLLALIRTESAQHPIHRVVVGVGAALRMTDSLRTRAYFGVPKARSIEFVPLWPPAEPPALTLIRPKSRSMSS